MGLSKIDALLKKLAETASAQGTRAQSIKEASGHGAAYYEAVEIAYDIARNPERYNARYGGELPSDELPRDLSDIERLDAFRALSNGGGIDRDASTIEILEKFSDDMRKELVHPVKMITSLQVGSGLSYDHLYLAQGWTSRIAAILTFLILLQATIKKMKDEDAEAANEPDYAEPDDQDDGPDGGHPYPDRPQHQFEAKKRNAKR